MVCHYFLNPFFSVVRFDFAFHFSMGEGTDMGSEKLGNVEETPVTIRTLLKNLLASTQKKLFCSFQWGKLLHLNTVVYNYKFSRGILKKSWCAGLKFF